MIMYTKGTVILCPKCGKELFKLIGNAEAGTTIKSALFQTLSQKPEDGDPMLSLCCKVAYFYEGGFVSIKEPNPPKTLKETISEMVERKQTETKEFKQLISFFGREKVKRLWLEHQKELKEKKEND